MEHKLLQESIREQLHRWIIDGDLRPGQQVNLDSLARDLGVSIIPVREALHDLAARGLIVMARHKSPSVVCLTPEEIEEVFLLRGKLEGLAARVAATKRSPQLTEGLSAVLDEMESELKVGGQLSGAEFRVWRRKYLFLNKRFHDLINRASGLPRLSSMIDDLWALAHVSRNTDQQIPDRIREAVPEHKAIVRALEQGDGSLAEQLVAEHLERGAKWLAPQAGPPRRVAGADSQTAEGMPEGRGQATACWQLTLGQDS